MVDELLWTEQQTADKLGETLYGLRKLRFGGGGPPFVVIGKIRIRYRPAAVRQWLEEREIRSMAEHYQADEARARAAAKQREACGKVRRPRYPVTPAETVA
jgi:hypothetical protein